MRRLTALAVRNTKEPGRYHDGDGLMLVVKPTGAKSWILRQQVNGKRRDIDLGSAKVVSLAEARQRAAATRKVCIEGGDPIAIRQAARNEVARMLAFEEAARTAHSELKVGWRNPKHTTQWISTLERYVFPDLGSIPVDAVTGPMVRDVLLSIWLDKPETARICGSELELSWAGPIQRDSETLKRPCGRLAKACLASQKPKTTLPRYLTKNHRSLSGN